MMTILTMRRSDEHPAHYRITSYNVCYTKLLRINKNQNENQNHNKEDDVLILVLIVILISKTYQPLFSHPCWPVPMPCEMPDVQL